MVIVLKNDVSENEKKNIKTLLKSKNFKINEVKGDESTILAAVGRLAMDIREVEVLPGVEKVVPISKPYKLASREFKPENTVVGIPNNRGQIIRIGGSRLVSIAGPCAVESREQMLEAAAAVSASGAVMLRGGAYKPRTSPYAFQGLGEEGLKYLKEAGEKYGLPVVTEIVDAEYIPVMESNGVDVYQVGARNMQNFELLKRLGKLGKPVILKRGLCATIQEWLMSAEYLLSSGTDKVILCERGIRTYETATRNTLDLSSIPVLRSLTHLPMIVDPSHAVGVRDKIPPMALAAVAAGSDGIIVEVHCHPEQALSDAAQALYPEQFEKIMRDVEALAPVIGKQVAHIRAEEKTEPKSLQGEEKKDSKRVLCAFSGKKGAYAEQAIFNYFEDVAEPVEADSFDEIFQEVVDGKVQYGMIPIENSTAGSVYNNYDNLTRYEDISIVGAVTIRVEHSLLAPKGATLESIKHVYSHPQGLAQCSNFIKKYGYKTVDTVSTATGAELVGEKNDISCAAIANARNAKLYGLNVLRQGIENDPNNYTRFVIIAANHTKNSPKLLGEQKPNRATLMFSTKNEAGALYDTLGVFKNAKLSMNRLESRPIAGKPWKYWFYSDVVIPSYVKNPVKYIDDFINVLKSNAEDIRLLGVYYE